MKRFLHFATTWTFVLSDCPFLLRGEQAGGSERVVWKPQVRGSMMASVAVGGTRSTFGTQTSSKRGSAPSYGFGSGTRAHREKTFVSQEHSALEAGKESPGPAVYKHRAAVGEQIDGKMASAPQWAFGTADRFMGNSKEQQPGPGAYATTRGIQAQVSSQKATAPMFGFGSSTRAHVEKVFISQDHNKGLHGINSPGPMAGYQMTAAVGNQVDSKKAGQPAWVMGKADRFVYDHVKRAAGAPGPGAYPQTPGVGPQVSSNKESSARYGFGTSNRDHMAKVRRLHE